MSKRIQATVFGVVCSLGGVAVWIVISLFLGWIAGIAGSLMGMLFLWGYNRICPGEEGKKLYLIAGIVLVIEIVLAEFLSLAIAAAILSEPFSAVLASDLAFVFINIILGIVLSGFVFARQIRRRSASVQSPPRQHSGNPQEPYYPGAQPQSIDPFAPVYEPVNPGPQAEVRPAYSNMPDASATGEQQIAPGNVPPAQGPAETQPLVTDLGPGRTCPKCGASGENQRFCSQCGSDLDA